jgi:hypothetical protein
MNKNKKKTTRKLYEFTILYFGLCKDLNIEFEEYIVLDAMRYYSKHNDLTESISRLSKGIRMSRTTVYSCLKKLHFQGHIGFDKDNKQYYLDADINERFENSKNSEYIIIYHQYRKKHRLSISEYGILYLCYSLSRKYGIAYPNYEEIIGIKERQYFYVKSKLKKEKLILNNISNGVTLTDSAIKYFDQQRNKSVQTLQSI